MKKTLILAALTLAACGPQGDPGPAGVNGTNGSNGANGTNAVQSIQDFDFTSTSCVNLDTTLSAKRSGSSLKIYASYSCTGAVKATLNKTNEVYYPTAKTEYVWEPNTLHKLTFN